jgi:hypothetical protein
MRRHRSILLSILGAVAVVAGCAVSKRDIETAKHSVFDAEFAVVYAAALEATRDSYPNLEELPGRGAIKTAWHQVSYASGSAEDMTGARSLANAQGINGSTQSGPSKAAAGMPTRLAYKRYFIRFDVAVAGGRPWRVKVVGHSAEWEPGAAQPTELRGPNRPTWLDGRTDALLYAIYNRIKPFAQLAKPDADPAVGEHTKADPGAFTGVPAGAGRRLAELKDAVVGRDFAALRGQLADDMLWSLGGAAGADIALATWQADPEPLDAMAKLLAEGCGGDAARVTCPAGQVAPGAYQLTLMPRGEVWQVTAYVKAE